MLENCRRDQHGPKKLRKQIDPIDEHQVVEWIVSAITIMKQVAEEEHRLLAGRAPDRQDRVGGKRHAL